MITSVTFLKTSNLEFFESRSTRTGSDSLNISSLFFLWEKKPMIQLFIYLSRQILFQNNNLLPNKGISTISAFATDDGVCNATPAKISNNDVCGAII